MTDYRILRFERNKDPDGMLMPLAVRVKLDLCGWKVGLKTWQAIDPVRCRELIALPLENEDDETRFRHRLLAALGPIGERPTELAAASRTGVDAWMAADEAPAIVRGLLGRASVSVDWRRLNRFGRFVLHHLAVREDVNACRACAAELDGERVGEAAETRRVS